jgi:hypothetical protein
MQMLEQPKAMPGATINFNYDFVLAKSHIGNLDGIARIRGAARSGKRAC